MRTIRLHLTIPDQSAALVYATLADLGRTLDYSPTACHVEISGATDTSATARWEANFRQGVLRWVNEGLPDLRPRYRDIDVFDGSWSCVDDGGDTAVTFAARLDLGTPSPGGELETDDFETMAVGAFIDDAMVIMSGLFDGSVRVDDIVIQEHQYSAA
jgi:hypothetical protein